ncbi:MAG: GlsB/YeaQ/YmgE family stress response membrane protein [Nocardioides sp.]|uniref:GlsB/YeaQ/YmgE family stress response membrane protein n=1 Tax=Nocardioides sp. TaxID=35761 RepID=UPI003F089B71
MLWTIIVTIVGGFIIGLLGKMFAPGDKDNIPLWATVVCGIVGMIVGNYLYAALFDCGGTALDPNCTRGIDWWRHVWQIVVAVLAVIGADAVLARRKA